MPRAAKDKMPKEKPVRKTKERATRRKKGKSYLHPAVDAPFGYVCSMARGGWFSADFRQTPTLLSVVFPLTCSSPTTTVTRFARRTPVSLSVSF